MLKWILILLVPGVILLSNLFGSEEAPESPSAPTQVQTVVPQAQSPEEKPLIQVEQKAETVKVAPKPATTSITACGEDYYRNVDGNCVHRPSDNPSGASARCRDGSYSYSENRRGTCSGHGGVSAWY